MGSLDDLGAVKVFDVTDGAETITVRLRGIVPPLFAEDVGVVVEGAWSGDEFAADLALVRHDENYQPPSTDRLRLMFALLGSLGIIAGPSIGFGVAGDRRLSRSRPQRPMTSDLAEA